MKHYLIILIYGGTRHVRNIIAASSVQAGRIGLNTMPQTDEPCAIICQPLRRLA
ncbi:MAG: hypothetical protein HKM00_09620 [Gallionella sp.]|nr:hypothetical protein [Gallionella sp.]